METKIDGAKNIDNVVLEKKLIIKFVTDFIKEFGYKTNGGIIQHIKIIFVPLSEATFTDYSIKVSYKETGEIHNIINIVKADGR